MLYQQPRGPHGGNVGSRTANLMQVHTGVLNTTSTPRVASVANEPWA